MPDKISLAIRHMTSHALAADASTPSHQNNANSCAKSKPLEAELCCHLVRFYWDWLLRHRFSKRVAIASKSP